MDITEIIGYATTAVTIASIITAATPTPRDDAVMAKFYKIIEVVGLNIGRAKETGK